MARARFLRPEFFTDEKVSDLPFGACVLFAGIWCHSDLRGVFEHNPRVLRGLIFPMRDGIDTAAVGKWLVELASAGMIASFEADGKAWGYVINWQKHQQISGRERDIGSTRPPPPDPGHAQACSKRVPITVPGHAQAATATSTATPTAAAATAPSNARARAEAAAATDEMFDGMQESPPLKLSQNRNSADVQAMHPTVFIHPSERQAWDAVLLEFGWDPVDDACKSIAAEPGARRILLSGVTAFLAKNYRKKA